MTISHRKRSAAGLFRHDDLMSFVAKHTAYAFGHSFALRAFRTGNNTYRNLLMNELGYDLMQMCRHNRDGSQATQYQRGRALRAMSEDLKDMGYRDARASTLKPKHVSALVTHWRDKGLSDGTMKNRLSFVRWWAEKVNRSSVVPKDNVLLGIDNRTYVTNIDKSVELDQRVDSIPDSRIRVSLELQRAFGLRREESLKFAPSYADRDDRLVLKASWTKGGRDREIPIRTAQQRAALDRAHQAAGSGSLIPPGLSYVQHLKVYERKVVNAGFSKLHGLRHAYAQQRYQELTARAAPAAGGLYAGDLTSEQRIQDREARLTISSELGHVREDITAVYLGR